MIMPDLEGQAGCNKYKTSQKRWLSTEVLRSQEDMEEFVLLDRLKKKNLRAGDDVWFTWGLWSNPGGRNVKSWRETEDRKDTSNDIHDFLNSVASEM